jgi:hypothetical protein
MKGVRLGRRTGLSLFESAAMQNLRLIEGEAVGRVRGSHLLWIAAQGGNWCRTHSRSSCGYECRMKTGQRL